ncbi:MAG: energy-coupling factor transporter transmembrane protein EcfT [Clostridia bacterium]|nr:energy-coupling factor transporter transmembrane protein EcfT [Clostridia bacterium]
MRSFADYHPIVVALYFLAVAGIAMFCANPILLVLSLVGALLWFLVRNGRKEARSHLFFALLFVCAALINPLVSHNGVTVLFVVNDSPITWEATVYGLVAATMILAVLYWFRSLTQILTSDKLLYLFAKLSPKLALVLSMGLRYVPLFTEQAKKIDRAQTGLGLYRGDNLPDRIRGKLRIFSVLITWALENGIVTADSMTARGYGTKRRTHFSIFRFRKADWLVLGLILTLSAVVLWGIFGGALSFTCYPAIVWPETTLLTVLAYTAYGLLALLPTLIEVEEVIKWRSLTSKI